MYWKKVDNMCKLDNIVSIGYIFFNEIIDIKDIIGIILIILGIYFILYNGPHGKEFLTFQ